MGNPLKRDTQKVFADYADGYLSAEAAKNNAFGVVIWKGKVSEAQTRALRKKLIAAQPTSDDKDLARNGQRGKAILRTASSVMKRLGISDGAALEIETEHGPVLGVWARQNRGLPADVIRIGALSIEILRLGRNRRIKLRRLPFGGGRASAGK